MEDQLVVRTKCPVILTTIELTRRGVGLKLLPQWMYLVANYASYQVFCHFVYSKVAFDLARFRVLRVRTLVVVGYHLVISQHTTHYMNKTVKSVIFVIMSGVPDVSKICYQLKNLLVRARLKPTAR